MGVVPKLHLGRQLIDPKTKKSKGVESTGEHVVKFLAEPTRVMGKSFEGKPQQELKFIVEYKGEKYRWMVPIMNKEGTDASYLLERVAELKIGDVRVLEMVSRGATKYIDIREVDGDSIAPDDDEIDEQAQLDKELAKEEE